jgi:hypothetical protein
VSDARLEARIRAGFQELDREAVPPSLESAVLAIPEETRAPAGFVSYLFGSRRLLVIGVAIALLIALLAGAVAVGWLPLPRADTTWEAVLAVTPQTSDESNSFFAEAGDGEPQQILTEGEFLDAFSPAWSSDGAHVAYVIGRDEDQLGVYSRFEVHIANGDGSNPVVADLPTTQSVAPEEKHYYHGPSARIGPTWSPDGKMVAVPWSTYSCPASEGPVCVPTSGVDVFSADGRAVTSFLTPEVLVPSPMWSPDSARIGYMSGYEAESGGVVTRSQGYSFNSQSITRADDLAVLPLDREVTIAAWTPGDRLLAIEGAPGTGASEVAGPTVAFTMQTDGSDSRDVRGEIPGCDSGCIHISRDILWSTDGRWVAFDSDERTVAIRRADTGDDLLVPVPTALFPWLWSPDGETLLLVSLEGSGLGSVGDVYVVNADGTGLTTIGAADDVAWMPLQ